MIRKLLKQIWNCRKANAWLVATLSVIAVALWFCIDIVYNFEVARHQSIGYDPERIFEIQLRYNWTTGAQDSMEADNRIIYNLIKDYPGAEEVAFFFGDQPFTDNRMFEGYALHSDSSRIVATYKRNVSPEFFSLFGIKPLKGQIDTDKWNDKEYPTPIIITEDFADSLFNGRTDVIGETFFNPYYMKNAIETNYRVMAVVPNQKPSPYSRYCPMVYMPAEIDYLGYSSILVKAKPDKTRTFASDFMQDMRKPLERGVFYLVEAESLAQREINYNLSSGGVSYTNATYAFITFFMFTAFLIVLGSFYIRSRRRRSEIALSMAMGCSRSLVVRESISEGLLILVLAMIPASVIILNIWWADLTINTLMDRTIPRLVLCIAATFIFLATVIALAILPSALQSSRIQPAVTLHDE